MENELKLEWLLYFKVKKDFVIQIHQILFTRFSKQCVKFSEQEMWWVFVGTATYVHSWK